MRYHFHDDQALVHAVYGRGEPREQLSDAEREARHRMFQERYLRPAFDLMAKQLDRAIEKVIRATHAD